MPNNIEKFDRVVAYVFAELYKSFPVRKPVSVYDFFDCKDQGEYIDGIWRDSTDLTSEDQKFFCDSIRWLIDSGYVIGTLQNHIDHRASLTLSLKGLHLMKSVPKSIDSKVTLGEQLISVIGTGAKDSAAELVSSALSYDNIITQLSEAFKFGQ
ncbi:hypothetical protein AB4437_22365 [Vibrio cyclitrophicus]